MSHVVGIGPVAVPEERADTVLPSPDDAAALAGSFNNIRAEVPAKGTEFEDYTHYYPFFLLPALGLLILDMLPFPRRRQKPLTVPATV